MKETIDNDFPEAGKTPRRISGGIDAAITGLFEGRKQRFDVSLFNWSDLTDFQIRVLKRTFKIPRGKVATYASLAAGAGFPKAARAAGSVMAKNPFPIVIPCHRVVRADRTVGRFGGGPFLKKQLLEKEGIVFDSRGKIPLRYLHQ